MEELVMLRLAVEAVVMKMVMEVMERMVMLMAVMAINIAMGVEMAVVMKVGATDNDDGDDIMIANILQDFSQGLMFSILFWTFLSRPSIYSPSFTISGEFENWANQ